MALPVYSEALSNGLKRLSSSRVQVVGAASCYSSSVSSIYPEFINPSSHGTFMEPVDIPVAFVPFSSKLSYGDEPPPPYSSVVKAMFETGQHGMLPKFSKLIQPLIISNQLRRDEATGQYQLREKATLLALVSLLCGLPCCSIPAVVFAFRRSSNTSQKTYYNAIICAFLAVLLGVATIIGLVGVLFGAPLLLQANNNNNRLQRADGNNIPAVAQNSDSQNYGFFIARTTTARPVDQPPWDNNATPADLSKFIAQLSKQETKQPQPLNSTLSIRQTSASNNSLPLIKLLQNNSTRNMSLMEIRNQNGNRSDTNSTLEAARQRQMLQLQRTLEIQLNSLPAQTPLSTSSSWLGFREILVQMGILAANNQPATESEMFNALKKTLQRQ